MTTSDPSPESDPRPAIQLLANLVVEGSPGQVLLARYNPGGESDEPEADQRWWLPAHELDPYQHPDEAARIALDEIGGLSVESLVLGRVQSFRGRRGWHISFDYRAKASGQPTGPVTAAWHSLSDLPPTMHGNWERDTIDALLATEEAIPVPD